MSKSAQAVAEVKKTEIMAAEVIDFGADAGHGMEEADAQSFAIPFLSVVQKMSPICDEASGSYNPDAKAGMLMNTVTGELYDGKEGVVFLPAHYQRRFLRWAPRETGGGFKGEMTADAAAIAIEEGEVKDVDGRLFYPMDDGSINEKRCDRLADVRNHFGVLEGSRQRVLLSLGSTQIKKSKALMSMLSAVKVKNAAGQMVTPPTWANRVRITTVLEQNDQGNWYGVKFELEGFVSDREDYEAGKDFFNAMAKGIGGEVRYAEPEGEVTASDKF
jgi:hypothetical protein